MVADPASTSPPFGEGLPSPVNVENAVAAATPITNTAMVVVLIVKIALLTSAGRSSFRLFSQPIRDFPD
jgi:hypothetical protein